MDFKWMVLYNKGYNIVEEIYTSVKNKKNSKLGFYFLLLFFLLLFLLLPLPSPS